MSNPFDQFASELNAAVPNAPAPASADPNPFSAPSPQQPVMNPGPPMYGGGAPAYGAPPPPMDQGYGQSPYMASPGGSNPYGMPQQAPPMPTSQPAQDGAMNGYGGYGMPPGSDPSAGSSFAPPSPGVSQPPAPIAGGYGNPPAPPFGGYDQQPPPPGPDAGFPGASPYGAPPPEAAPPSPGGNPFGAPAPPMPPAPAPPAPAGDNPFGGYDAAPAPVGVAPMPPQGPPAAPANPYGVGGGQSQYSDPWGAPAAPNAMVPAGQPADPMAGALVPSQQAQPYGGGADPFAVFASAPAPEPAPAPIPIPEPAAAPPQSDDPWAELGFDPPTPVVEEPKPDVAAPAGDAGVQKSRESGPLPPGGEWYDARIFTPTLGVMFFKPQELTDSLFLQTDKEIVDALEERPVVAFIVEGSSARSAGVELGHVLLKVNGIDVKNPKDASRLIKEGPRPLPLLFYVPDTNVVVAEGEHMVKYDTRETTAPNSAKDWKPKYVVIGGIIAQPWMMNMYRSKSEYDIAVIETQARRPVSVKVKQFSLQGARIQNDWQGPQMVKYKNKLHPWKYIVVLPVARNPIKISSPNLSQLKPVHEGIRRVLLSQQRGRSNAHTAGPVRGDPYTQSQNGHGGYHESHNRDPYANGGGSGAPRRGDGYHESQPPPSHGSGYDAYAGGHAGGHGGGHGGGPGGYDDRGYGGGGGGHSHSRGPPGGQDPYAVGGGDPYARGY